MRPGRELDTMVAKYIFNHEVVIKRKIPTEVTPAGERPLREYSKEIGAAFDVAKKMNISLIPIEGGSWFALAGNEEGFSSPASFIEYLSAGNFVDAGAAVSESAPLSICLAAMKAISAKMKRETEGNPQSDSEDSQEDFESVQH